MEQRKGGFSASGTNFSERSYQLKIKRQKKQKFTKKELGRGVGLRQD